LPNIIQLFATIIRITVGVERVQMTLVRINHESRCFLRPMLKLVKEYQSPISCAEDEEIDDFIEQSHLGYNHWMLIHSKESLYQISANGEFNEKDNYNSTSRCAIPFGTPFLTILTNESINFDELYYDH